jgi:hypothetical protein
MGKVHVENILPTNNQRLQATIYRSLRDSELGKLEGRKELFILYFIKTNAIRALRTACVDCECWRRESLDIVYASQLCPGASCSYHAHRQIPRTGFVVCVEGCLWGV